jgi:acyl carrier protein
MTHTTPFVETVEALLGTDIPVRARVDSSHPLHSDEIRDFVRSVIARYGGLGDGVIAMRRPLLDYGIGVLALIDVVMDVEARFGIELDPDEILSWLTAADVVETVGAALSATSIQPSSALA